MKRLFALLMLLFVVSFQQSYAQGRGYGRGQGRGAGQNSERQLQTLKDTLNLTPAQVDSVKIILKEFQPQLREVFMDETLARDERRKAIQKINAQRNKRIKALLTKEQRQKFTEFEARRHQENDQRIKDRFGE